MTRNLLSIAQSGKTQRIGLWIIVKNDIIPWFVSAGFALLLFAGVATLIGGVRPDMSNADATANLYTWARPFYIALVILACLLARRSRDIRTWVLAGILIIFFIPQTAVNFAIALWPNSILQAMIAMLGFLAAGRVVEYIHMRYVVKLDEPILSLTAFIGYMLLVCGAIFLDAPLFFEFLGN